MNAVTAVRVNPVAALLESAEDVFAQRGLEGATTGLIAERAGVPKATLHYHFRTKDVLYKHVLQDVFQEWLQASNSFDEVDDPAKAISGYVQTKMELARRRPKGSKIWAQEMIAGAPHLRDMLLQEVKPWMDSRVARIEQWVAAGRMAPVRGETLMFMIWAMTQHYADFEAQIRILTNTSRLTKSWFERATEEVTTLVLRSVGLEPALVGVVV